MHVSKQGVSVRVWGDYACFTRPEMKVERVSYDVMTPSAARGILDAIFWKPQIRWVVQSIKVLKPIRWASVRRNEVSKVVSARTASTAMNRGRGNLHLFVDECRQQRASLLLKDVDYVVHARFDLTDRADEEDRPGKYTSMIQRRLANGQCFHRPYLGCREFAAHFAVAEGQSKPISETRDLGWMLYDLDYQADCMPRFFRAHLENGVLTVPSPTSREVRG